MHRNLVVVIKCLFQLHQHNVLPFKSRVRGGKGRSIPRHDSTRTQFSLFVLCSDSDEVPLPLSESSFSSCNDLTRASSFRTAWMTSLTEVRKFKFCTSFSSLPTKTVTEPNWKKMWMLKPEDCVWCIMMKSGPVRKKRKRKRQTLRDRDRPLWCLFDFLWNIYERGCSNA